MLVTVAVAIPVAGPAPDEEQQGTQHAIAGKPGGRGRVRPAMLAPGERRQRQRRQRTAGGDESERPHVARGRLLEQESCAPEGSGKQQQEVGVEAAHWRRISQICRTILHSWIDAPAGLRSPVPLGTCARRPRAGASIRRLAMPAAAAAPWGYLAPIALLVCSNVFMTLASVRPSQLQGQAAYPVVVASWGIAFIEYCLAVPANRGGTPSIRRPSSRPSRRSDACRVLRLLRALSQGTARGTTPSASR